MKIVNVRSQNNFDLIRFLASALVLFSHSFPLVRNERNEPLNLLSDGQYTGGRLAVIVFFILSGFLIASSWDGRKNLPGFLYSRILRIFPALAVVLILSIAFSAFISTSDFFNFIKSSFFYFIKNITLYKITFDIDGVFLNNPYGTAINGSLWTLRHEFSCYLVIGAFGYLGILTRNFIWIAWLISLIFSSLEIFPSTFMRDFLPLLCWFLTGTLVYLHREVTFFRSFFIMATVFISIFIFFKLNLVFISPVVAFLLINLAYAKSPFFNFGKYGDFSYGIYIYAFPIQQLVIYCAIRSAIDPIEWWMVFVFAFPITLICSFLSWHLIEKKFIKMKIKIKN